MMQTQVIEGVSAGGHLTGATLPTILPWFGGKHRYAPWILSQLPPVVPGQTYGEPFAGMASVLRLRRRAAGEIINDLDQWVVNWWRVVKDHKDRLAHELAHTPHSRWEHSRCRDLLNAISTGILESGADVRIDAAHAWTVCIGQGHAPKRNGGFGYSSEARRHAGDWWHEILDQLRDRFSAVVVEHYDALELMERLVGDHRTVIYADPPYSQGGDAYDTPAWTQADRDRMVEIVERGEARVAISGYPSCFPDLSGRPGWFMQSVRVSSQMAAGRREGDPARTECLWTNYPPPMEQGVLC